MNHIKTIFLTTCCLVIHPLVSAQIWSTDVFLENKTNKTITLSPIQKTVKKFKGGSESRSIGKAITIKAHETRYLFSVPRSLSFADQYHTVSFAIRHKDEPWTLPISIMAKKEWPLLPTHIEVKARSGKNITVEHRFVHAFGTFYPHLFITVEKKSIK